MLDIHVLHKLCYVAENGEYELWVIVTHPFGKRRYKVRDKDYTEILGLLGSGETVPSPIHRGDLLKIHKGGTYKLYKHLKKDIMLLRTHRAVE